MKKPVHVFFASLTCLGLLAFLVNAQQNSSLVFGSVLLQTSDQIMELKGVEIELIHKETKSKHATRTSYSGKFLFKSIPHGQYLMKVKNANGIYYSFEDRKEPKTALEFEVSNTRTNMSETIVYQPQQ